MQWFLKKCSLILFGFFVLVVLPGLSLNRADREPRPDTSAGDWNQVRSAAENIDQLINQYAAENDCEAASTTTDWKIVRRLSLALLGTIPSLEEIRAFESLGSEDRLEQWTDRLLQDPRCHDYLAERFARAMVSSLPVEPFFIYRRRRFVSWLSDQMAANRPYDELVREILTAEGLWTDTPAANFITAHEMDPTRLANRTARAFLGLRLDCAECHNHPFANWTQEDFRGLAAYFGQCEFGFQGVKDVAGKQYTVEDPETKARQAIEPRAPFPLEVDVTHGRLREQLANWVASEDNSYFAAAIANRMWRLMFGRGVVEPVDDLEADESVPGLLDVLAAELRDHAFDLRHLIRVITATDAFRRRSAVDGETTVEAEELFAAFPLTRLRPEQVASSLVQASTLHTLDYDRNLLIRLAALGNRNDFVELYGDAQEEELAAREGNIPQRLLMMNGKVAHDRTQAGPLSATTRISTLAPTDEQCVATAYLITVCRPPTKEESEYFQSTLQGKTGEPRRRAVEDLMWALVNCTEFSWNH